MDTITSGLQTTIDTLRAGIEAIMNIFGGVQSYAEAGNQVAAGTGAFAEAFKTIYNIFAGFLGFAQLDAEAEPDPIKVVIVTE